MKRGIILFTLLVLAACAQEPQPEPIQLPPPTDIQIVTKEQALPDKPRYEPPPTAPDEDTITTHYLEAVNYDFLPSELTVAKGDAVRLVITAMDEPHTFTLDAYGIDETLPVGQDVTIEFIADEEGTFIFESTTPSDSAQRMRGKLIVT